MARLRPEDYPAVVKAIMAGEHDDDLNLIQNACQARMKNRFRRGSRVRLTGTRNVEIDGMEGVVVKVNPKRITVRLTDDREFNVPPNMMEVL